MLKPKFSIQLYPISDKVTAPVLNCSLSLSPVSLRPEGTLQIKTAPSDEPCWFKSPTCAQTFWVAVDKKNVSVLQELPKYLRGYHVCTKEELINIAAQLFRIKVGNDKSQIVTIPKILKELVPADQLKAMSENEWKKVGGAFIFAYDLKCGLKDKDDVTLCSHDQNKTNNNKNFFDFLILVPPEDVNLWQESEVLKNYKTQHTAEANDDPKFCSDSCAKLLRFFLRGTLISNTFYGSSSNICLAHCPVHLQYISMTTTFQCLDFHQIIYIDNLVNRSAVSLLLRTCWSWGVQRLWI